MALRNNFCVFILSHGRSDRLLTLDILKSQGYTGPWYIVVDNEDSSVEDYIAKCGEEHVLIFDKKSLYSKVDIMDNKKDYKAVVYARNACFPLAKQLGYQYFLMLDDDYLCFELREQSGEKLLTFTPKNLNDIFEAMLQFLDDTGADSVAFAQGGDMIGGVHGGIWEKKMKRKVMNTFFCNVDKPFKFMGRINEDVNAYTLLGSQGKLFLTIGLLDIRQVPTQVNPDGLTDVYINNGTYQKSFYTIMLMPSCVKIGMMGEQHLRMHHNIDWNACVPKIISSKFKKGVK